MASTVFGDLRMPLFVAGAVFGEIRLDSQSANKLQYKMRLRSAKRNLGERAGSVEHFHARIMVGSFSNRPPL